jgi:hypothetical protein
MSTRTKRAAAPPRRPEKKYGPFAGGCGVVVWLNEVETDAGTRWFRSVQIAPRRYRSKKTGEWEDSQSLRVTDIPSLVLGLEAAHQFCATTPLPGQPAEEEHVEEAVANDGNGTPPF